MLNEILKFTTQFVEAEHIFANLQLPKIEPNRVILAGMGGSSLHLFMIKEYLKDYYNVEAVQEYAIPNNVDKNTLILTSSFSGNTEESIATLEDACSKNTEIFVISNGGKLKEIADKEGLMHIKIPDVPQPRFAVGYNVSFYLLILEYYGLIPKNLFDLDRISEFLETEKENIHTYAKEIAPKLKDKLPVVYASQNNYGLARDWKINFNENSKIQSFFNVFPELNHNELAGWTHLVTNPVIIYLRSDLDHERIQRRMNIMKEILEEKILFLEIELKGENHLEKMMWGVLLSILTSYYLALEYDIDPVPVEIIESFKKRL